MEWGLKRIVANRGEEYKGEMRRYDAYRGERRASFQLEQERLKAGLGVGRA